MHGDSMTMFGMGLWWLLSIVIVGLIAAAAIKYLFFHPRRRERSHGNAHPDDGRAGRP